MIGFAIFCIQILFVQHGLSQAVIAPSNINNGIPRMESFGPMNPGLGTASLAAANMGAGIPGQMIANGANAAFNQIGAQPHGMAPGQMGIAPGQMGVPSGQIGVANGQIGIPNGQMGMAAAQMNKAAAQRGMAAAQMGMQPGQAATSGQKGIPLSQMGVPAGINSNMFKAGTGTNYGGSGSGDVAVAGELPVAGTTSITGQVPMSGKVAFTGTLPAGGMVTISGQCGGVSNPAPLSTPYGTKPGFNNKPYLH